MSSLSLILLALFMSGSRGPRAETFPPAAAEARALGERCIAVVGTNDAHGHISPETVDAGDQALRYGGILAMSGYVARLREHYGDATLVLDGGDLYQGTLASNLSRGRAIIAAYNAMGYHATAVGNHEFDFGPVEPDDPDRLGVLKRRSDQSAFPWLALNVFEREGHRPVDWPNTRPSALMQIGELTVGVVGLSTPETPKVTRPQNVTTLEFREPVPLIVAEARQLRAKGADLVVMTAHIGGVCGSLADPDDPSSCDPDEELHALLTALPEGTLDVAVGGHTHRFVAHWINGTATIESGAYGRYVGWVEACAEEDGGIDREASRIQSAVQVCLETWDDGTCGKRAEPTAVAPATFLGGPVEPDPEVVKTMAPYLDSVAVAKAEALGIELPEPLERKGHGPDSLGTLVAEGMARTGEAQIGVQNLGGVRADLPAGTVRFGQVFQVLPFGNKITVLTLTGAELEQMVRHLIGRRDMSPYLWGLEAREEDGAWRMLLPDGSPLRADATYEVATNDFLSMGGEGLDVILEDVPESRVRYLDIDMRDGLIELLRSRYPAPGAEGAQ